MTHKTPFIVAELGADADPFMLHLYAALAEKEQRAASQYVRVLAPGARVGWRSYVEAVNWFRLASDHGEATASAICNCSRNPPDPTSRSSAPTTAAPSWCWKKAPRRARLRGKHGS